MKLIKTKAALLYATFTSSFSFADAIDLGTPSSGPLASVGKFFQEIVNFLGGTGTLTVVFIGVFAGIALWVAIPKQAGAAVGWIFRALVGAIGLFVMGTTIAWLQTF